MLKELFQAQRQYINNFFDNVDLAATEEMVNLFLRASGSIVFTGVGKSGFIAEKLAMTMVSTGVRASYLPPTNAAHGDLGLVNRGDLFVLLSKSGESDELLELIPYVRNKGAQTIAWVCTEGSRLEKACDHTMILPLERELCPFDLAPTTSDAIQLLFGNVIAVALMQARNFTLSDYAQNHPAGRIGKRIAMKVSDLMLEGEALPVCAPADRLVDRLVTLSDKRCGCLLIAQGDKLVGIFTDGDLRRALQERGPSALELRLEELMNTHYKEIAPEALAVDALQIMEGDQKRPFMVLPVVRDGHLAGLVKLHDLIQSGI